jgi:hypothetical protein
MINFTKKRKNQHKENRELVANISMFLLTNEKLKGLFWSIKTVDYTKFDHTLKIGINTTKKLGTTLTKMRSVAKDLANYLFENGITVMRQTQIVFYVDKEDEIIARIYSLIEKVEEETKLEA